MIDLQLPSFSLLLYMMGIMGNVMLVGLGLHLRRSAQASRAHTPRPLLRQPEAQILRRQTPGLAAFVRIELISGSSPREALQRYHARPLPLPTPMQHLVGEALTVSAQSRMRPFAALAQVARSHHCHELSDLTIAMAEAEAEGLEGIERILRIQQEALESLLDLEFRRLTRRRTIYLVLLVAISLVVGLLLNLLWWASQGARVFFPG